MPQADLISNPSSLLSLTFAVALLVGLLLKFWLASRQIRHVAQHRSAVPVAFAQTIIEKHTSAKTGSFCKTSFSELFLKSWANNV